MGLSFGRVHSEARLDGKTAIITGCNTGIGKVTALRFAKIGARVIMACRDVQKAEEAAADIRAAVASLDNSGQVRVERLDLTSLASVRECAQRILDSEPKIHLLVNNAGVMLTPFTKTDDGFELQFGVNHLGHFLFTCLLLQRIVASAPSRIVNVSSRAYENGQINFDDLNPDKSAYSSFRAYGQSKLANILFTRELAKRLEGTGVTSYALHPGVVRTELGRYMDDTYFPGLRRLLYVFSPFFKSPEQGAETTIHCSIDEKAGSENGLYYSDCAVKTLKPQGLDDEAAKKLWEESARLVKLDFDPFQGLNKNDGKL